MKILIVSHFYPPLNKVPSQRVYQLAKNWSKAGHEVRLLTTKKRNLDGFIGMAHDASVLSDSYELDFISPVLWFMRLIKPSLLKEIGSPVKKDGVIVKNGAKNKLARGGYWALTVLKKNVSLFFDYTDLRAVIIGPSCKKWVKDYSPDFVFSSYSPAFSIRAGREVKLLCPNATWLVDYRDPWSDNYNANVSAFVRGMANFKEKKMVEKADAIVSVTQKWVSYYEDFLEKPVKLVYNGYDLSDEDFISSQSSGVNYYELLTGENSKTDNLYIVYAGTYYRGGQDFSDLFEAVKQFNDRQRKGLVNLVFFGRNTDLIPNDHCNCGGVNDAKYLGVVDRETAFGLMTESDCLLLDQWGGGDSSAVVPAKTFDYFLTGKPVLLHAHTKGSELETIVVDASHNRVVRNVTDCIAFLEGLVGFKKGVVSKESLYNRPLSRTEDYNRFYQSQKIIEFVQGL